MSKTNDSFELMGFDESVHDETKMFECELCQYKTCDISNLKLHMDVHLNASKAVEGKGKRIHICDSCDKKFQTKSSLNLHIRGKHLLQFRFKCVICSKGFMFLYNYKGH